jgi:SPX domain protein involved in polyphosphate accumulation
LVNNIYFDDSKKSNYCDNIEGNTNRKKYRIRWYNTVNKFANFEIKNKYGETGD